MRKSDQPHRRGTIKVGVFSALMNNKGGRRIESTSLQTHFKNISSAYSA